MPKKRKRSKSLLWKTAVLLWKITKWTFTSIFKAIAWLFSRSKDTVKKKTLQSKRKKISPEAAAQSFSEIETNKGDLIRFESNLLKKSSLIGIILGARGTGKSAIGMRILENVYAKKRRPCYAIGFSEDNLPSWISVVDNIDAIKNNSFVLIDEGGILFSSRSSMNKANKLLSELLLIARHKDLSILFITQNSSNLEINAIRQADFLIMKPSSLLQKDFERNKIKDIYDNVMDKFEEHKEDPGLTYIYSNDFVGFASNTLPSFWNMDVSKGFRNK